MKIYAKNNKKWTDSRGTHHAINERQIFRNPRSNNRIGTHVRILSICLKNVYLFSYIFASIYLEYWLYSHSLRDPFYHMIRILSNRVIGNENKPMTTLSIRLILHEI